MNSDELEMHTEKLDRIITELLGPVRTEKRVSEKPFGELMSLLDHYEHVFASQTQIPKALVGKLYFIFTSMLAEADHSRDPDVMLNPAWEIQEKLRQIFGPRF